MTRRLVLPSLLSLPLALVLGGAAPASADAAATYQAQCARCHGADGRSQTPAGKAMKAPSLVEGEVAAKDAAALADAIRGVPQHKSALAKLSPGDLEALAGYVHGLAAAE